MWEVAEQLTRWRSNSLPTDLVLHYSYASIWRASQTLHTAPPYSVLLLPLLFFAMMGRDEETRAMDIDHFRASFHVCRKEYSIHLGVVFCIPFSRSQSIGVT